MCLSLLSCLWKCPLFFQSSNNVHMLSSLDMQSRKRGRSPDKTQDDAQSHKRRRMMSCTDLFNNRIKDLRQKLDEENLALRDSYNEELNRLSIKQQEEQERYYRSSAPPHILKRQMMDLQYHQLKVLKPEVNFQFESLFKLSFLTKFHCIFFPFSKLVI